MRVSIMTFNLRVDNQSDHKSHRGWEEREQLVVQLINQRKPSVIGTQEGLLHQLRSITDKTSYKLFGESRIGSDKDEYCAVLYDSCVWEVLEGGNFSLSTYTNYPGSHDWSQCPRMATWVILSPNGKKTALIGIINTHLDHRSGTARQKSTILIRRKLLTLMDTYPDTYFFVTGDFNSFRGDTPYKTMSTVLVDAWTEARYRVNDHIRFTCHLFRGIPFGRDGIRLCGCACPCLLSCIYRWFMGSQEKYFWPCESKNPSLTHHIDWILFVNDSKKHEWGPSIQDWSSPRKRKYIDEYNIANIGMKTIFCDSCEVVTDHENDLYPSDHFPVLAQFYISTVKSGL